MANDKSELEVVIDEAELEAYAKEKETKAKALIKRKNGPQIKYEGGFYNIGNKKIPDSARIQQEANNLEHEISVGILATGKDDVKAWATVRATNKRGQYMDGAVTHYYEIVKEVMILDMINQGRLQTTGNDENGKPILAEKSKYWLYNRFIRWKNFADRDAVTKATRIAQYKLLNKDPREQEEKDSEAMEVRSVNNR